MSLYRVEYHEITPEVFLECAADIMYQWYEWPSKHFPQEDEYRSRVVADSSGLPCIVAFRNDWFAGGMTISEPSTDSHFPGTGRYLLNVVTHPMEVGATQAMFGVLMRMLRQERADWLHITRRLSETEFRSTFRRLRHGQESIQGAIEVR